MNINFGKIMNYFMVIVAALFWILALTLLFSVNCGEREDKICDLSIVSLGKK